MTTEEHKLGKGTFILSRSVSTPMQQESGQVQGAIQWYGWPVDMQQGSGREQGRAWPP